MTVQPAGSGSKALWRVLGLLEGVKRTGSGWKAQCPAHEDHDPSLGVSEGRDGRVLLLCRVGCSTADICAALGLTLADLFEQTSDGRTVRRHRYDDASGQLVGIHWRAGDGKDKKVGWGPNGREGLGGARLAELPLYRLPELLAAEPGAEVYVCEGEKAADALADHGLLAVAFGGGSGTVPADAVLKPLLDYRPILWADADAPGRVFMEGISRRIEAKVAVREVCWPIALESSDAYDFFEQGGTVGDLALLVAVAEALPPERRNGQGAIEIFSAAELVTMELAEPRWAVPGVWPEGVVLLVGKSKLGKSWLALDAGIAVARGGLVWGKLRIEQGDVLYLALEDSKRRLRDRIYHLCGKLAPARLSFTTRWPRADEGGQELILAWIEAHPEARMVIIDVLGKFRPREANNRRLYDLDYEAVAPIAELARERGICVVIVHHTNKLNPDDPLDSVSGTTGLVGAADAICILRRERGQLDASLFVTGRDVDEQDLAFRQTLKEQNGRAWELLGDGDDYRMGKDRARVLEVLRAEPGLKPHEMAPLVGKTPGGMRKMLFEMVHAGQVRVRDSRYYAPEKEDAGISPLTRLVINAGVTQTNTPITPVPSITIIPPVTVHDSHSKGTSSPQEGPEEGTTPPFVNKSPSNAVFHDYYPPLPGPEIEGNGLVINAGVTPVEEVSIGQAGKGRKSGTATGPEVPGADDRRTESGVPGKEPAVPPPLLLRDQDSPAGVGPAEAEADARPDGRGTAGRRAGADPPAGPTPPGPQSRAPARQYPYCVDCHAALDDPTRERCPRCVVRWLEAQEKEWPL